MKEQEYMKLMGMIRGEYLEEAVSWDGSERRRIRQIRRMTVSFGAVAASLALVIGMIAYKAQKQNIPTADSVPESSLVSIPDESSTVTDPAQKQNLFGGSGELFVLRNWAGEFYCDNDYVYTGLGKFSVHNDGKPVPMQENADTMGLLTDGRNLYRVHDGKLFETDSFGNETALMTFAEYSLPAGTEGKEILRVRRLCDSMISILYGQQDWSDTQLVIADLSAKQILQQPDADYTPQYTEAESGYYAVNGNDGSVIRYDLQNGKLIGTEILGAIENRDGFAGADSVRLADQKLYLLTKQDEDGTGTPVYRYLIRDLATGRTTEKTFPAGQSVTLGSAVILTSVEDGIFKVRRSDLNLSDEQLIFSVPVTQYLGTAQNLTVGSEFVYESESVLYADLPTNGKPTLHGETAVIIDLRTGKTVFIGEHYDDGTEPENTTAVPVVTVTDAGTAVTTATTALTTETSAAATTAADSLTDEKRREFAEDLINRYCEAYEGYAYGGSVKYDYNSSDVLEVPAPDNPDYKWQYFRATSMNSVAEVKQKIAESTTGQAYDDLIGIMEAREGSDVGMPIYRESDGKLYVLQLGKGGQFLTWFWDTLTISNVTENGFTASLKHRTYGGYIEMYYFDFTDVKDGAENSFRVSHVIYTSTDERIIDGVTG